MQFPTCPHGPEKMDIACFKMVEGYLIMVYYCDTCNDEFFREPTESEINQAKNLALIK
ncbi:MAG: hypothetical protein Q7K65_05760 [Candidatus Buchananbacteria bacterium]|nr:hypothetical protein [Candidatus Buchananbacteria bacterium]